MVVGLAIGFLVAIPFFIAMIAGTAWAQKFAKQAIKDDKIQDFKKVDAALKILNVGKDSESKHLWQKLNELKEKSEKAC